MTKFWLTGKTIRKMIEKADYIYICLSKFVFPTSHSRSLHLISDSTMYTVWQTSDELVLFLDMRKEGK